MPIPSREKFREDVVENSSWDIYKRFNNVFNRFNNIWKAASKFTLENDDKSEIREEIREITYEKDGKNYQIKVSKGIWNKTIRVSRHENGKIRVNQLAEIDWVLYHEEWYPKDAKENASKEDYIIDEVKTMSDEYFSKNILPFFEEAINDAENYKRKTDQEKIKEAESKSTDLASADDLINDL